jgi:hypothetical protein
MDTTDEINHENEVIKAVNNTLDTFFNWQLSIKENNDIMSLYLSEYSIDWKVFIDNDDDFNKKQDNFEKWIAKILKDKSDAFYLSGQILLDVAMSNLK